LNREETAAEKKLAFLYHVYICFVVNHEKQLDSTASMRNATSQRRRLHVLSLKCMKESFHWNHKETAWWQLKRHIEWVDQLKYLPSLTRNMQVHASKAHGTDPCKYPSKQNTPFEIFLLVGSQYAYPHTSNKYKICLVKSSQITRIYIFSIFFVMLNLSRNGKHILAIIMKTLRNTRQGNPKPWELFQSWAPEKVWWTCEANIFSINKFVFYKENSHYCIQMA
jgi:hypothetical protein